MTTKTLKKRSAQKIKPAYRSGTELVALNDHYTVYNEHMQCCVRTPPDTVCPFAVGPTDYNLDLMAQFYQKLAACCDRECQRIKRTVMTRNCPVANPMFLPDHPGIGQVF